MRGRAPVSAAGVAYALAAYVIWGVLPLYFQLLVEVGAFEVVGWRVLLSLVFCLVLLALTRGWSRIGSVVRNRRRFLALGLAAALIYINWQTFIIAALSGHVVETSLGYFINPLVVVLLGAFVLKERMTPAQWVAIGISAIAVIVIAVGYGTIPWIALILAFTFGLYGLVKKRVAGDVDALSGLTVETVWLAPLAIVQLVICWMTVGPSVPVDQPVVVLAVAGLGVVTAIPLLLFASASRRIPLTYLGFIQFINPIIMFIVGVVALGEPMPLERLLGFALVWVALVVLCIDMYVFRKKATVIPTDIE